MDYDIFADVSIDIDREFAVQNKVRYIAMEYMLGEESFLCTEPEDDAMMHQYYEKLRNKIPTRTSQITPNHYIAVFEPYAKEKKGLLYLSLSSGLSSTYESAQMAVSMLEEKYGDVRIEVVDSLGATGGMGLLVESACANRDAGMSVQENAAWLREYAGKVNYWFKVEDLMYLKRGGRISAATAVMGTALSIKPILTINGEGKLDTVAKKRGNRQALGYLTEQFEKDFDSDISKVVYICGADCPEDAQLLKDMVLEINPEVIVRMTMLSPIIGAHTGPNMLALVYYGVAR